MRKEIKRNITAFGAASALAAPVLFAAVSSPALAYEEVYEDYFEEEEEPERDDGYFKDGVFYLYEDEGKPHYGGYIMTDEEEKYFNEIGAHVMQDGEDYNEMLAQYGTVIIYGDEQELPVATKDHYTFAGWNTSEDGTGEAYEAEAEVKPEGSLRLFAQWIPDDSVTLVVEPDGE